ncbi:MAG TPA: topoisomerase C-terminal repeat-containing protein, partial [Alphaproteobacteria bacterium]
VDKADKKAKPKRASLPKGMDPEKVDLEIARALLSLPREVGRHPSTGEMITAGIGRFGPYLKHGSTYVSLKGDDDVLTIGLNRAVTLIAEKPARGGRQPLRTLGTHPDDGKPVELHRGRYGPYVKHARTNATLPRDLSEESVTLEQALALIAERAAKPKGGKRRAAAARDKAPKAAKTAKPAKLPKRVANSAKSADDGTGKPRRAAGGGD